MAGAELPVGTVTFVFTDIEGSTSLIRKLGDAFGDVIDRHNRVLGDAVARAGGRVVRISGDGFFCAFASAPRAVSAAVDAQRTLAAQVWPGDAEVRVRMGIHTGEGVLGGDSYVGIDVHRAARIAAAGHGGQVLLSNATATLVSDDLPGGVDLHGLGEHELKDLGRAERLHQLVIEGLDNSFPPIRSTKVGSGLLPAPLTSFVGRRDELARLAELIAGPGLVTVIGPGGSGKTRLAIEVARTSTSTFEGSAFVDLSAISNPDLLPSFVASAMSIVDSVSTPASDLIGGHVAASRYLLALDNCEHLLEEVATLAAKLLARCPRLTVMTTSRELLGVGGEKVLPVSGLRLEDDEDMRDAVELFVDRASAVAAHVDTERSAPEIAELCRRLDGIPLAIELAAARANVLAPREILERLDDRFELLRSRSTTALPRHRSLEAAVSWSYDSLAREEQSVLRRLSVFRGGFTLEAAEAVCVTPDADLAEIDVLEVLSSLAAKSLVSVRLAPSGTRYELLETIREYAALRLEDLEDAQTVEAWHADYFVEWARGEARRVATRDQLTALAHLEADHDNLRAVLERDARSEDGERALAMAASLVWFWYVHSHFTEGHYWTGRLLSDPGQASTRTLVRLLIGAGDFDFRIGEHDRAATRFDEALRRSRQLGSRSLEMWALAYRGTNDALRLRLDEAAAALEEALGIANELGDFLGVGYCTFMTASLRGWEAFEQGELERLPPLLESLESLGEMVRSAGERNMVGHVQQGVGLLAHLTGKRKQARAAIEESITAFAEINTLACASHALDAAALVVAESSPATTMRLLAGTESIRTRIGVKTPPLEAAVRTLASEAALPALAADDLVAASEEGRHLTVAEATALARQTLVLPAGSSRA